MKCVDCPNYKECVKTKDLRTARRHCSLALRPSDTKKTNFDRIKEMSVDEMSTFICRIYGNDEDFVKFINGTYIQCYGENSIKDWLESEA